MPVKHKSAAPQQHVKRVLSAVRRPGGGSSLGLIRLLSEASGVSGDEGAVRRIVLERLTERAAETRVDALGNLLVHCRTRGKPSRRVLLAAHMDEVGLMLMQAGNEGLWKFEPVGGVNESTLPATQVLIGRDRIPGVIGMKPIHLMEKEDVEKPIKADSLAIDIGAKNKEEALARCKPGDRAVFATGFRGERGVLMGKALDNRLGVAALAELAADPPPGLDLWAAFTVQEEVGLRGAGVAAYAVEPDLAFVLDTTPANDYPMWDGTENLWTNTRLGAGAAIYVADRGTLSDPRLVALLATAGTKKRIPFQIRQPGGGGTDAGVIHRTRRGIPSVSISVPARGLHSPVSTARLDDWRSLVELVRAALEKLGQEGLPA